MTFDINRYKQTALKILSPIKPADEKSYTKTNILFSAQRSKAGYKLPEYFLIYFLLNDLLDFRDLGQYFEKVAWSFPIDYKGKIFVIEYRKMGVGVFVQDLEKDESDAEEIVKKLNGAIKSATPFYDYIAEEAVKKSEFNINNNCQSLFQRFQFLLSLYKKELKKYHKNKENVKVTQKTSKHGTMTSYDNVGFKYYKKANWLAISTIEAFFSWTEHLFIHLSVVAQNLSDGDSISKLIDAEWKDKFKAAIVENSKESNKFFDELLIIRQQLRNFVAHGAFGKNGNAFL